MNNRNPLSSRHPALNTVSESILLKALVNADVGLAEEGVSQYGQGVEIGISHLIPCKSSYRVVDADIVEVVLCQWHDA